ncbi:Glycosyltransferase family 61 protein [Striga hermonthica]|uniref:Glycosyltransferase family 61 protein n=1 Tax=Striga hermonthica TaxID=68872 RepID=A0A9N7RDC6_STRHE|nr:Glycosyltransferase family 61 protein [Striga hermonthica]
MAYDPALSKSYSQQELKKLGSVVLFVCFLMALTFRTVLKQPDSSAPDLFGLDSLAAIFSPPDPSEPDSKAPLIRNLSSWKSDVLEITGDIRIHGPSSTVFVASTSPWPTASSIYPYARKGDKYIMDRFVTRWQISPQPPPKLPKCHRWLLAPAVLFSGGGYSGNHFHDFTDILIPLYLTAKQFNRDVHLLVADPRREWLQKYKLVLGKLSRHVSIDVSGSEKSVLCFGRAVLGLRAHKEFGIDPSQTPHYTMAGFRGFMRATFSLPRAVGPPLAAGPRPRMLIISRVANRFLTNEDEVANGARGLGFEVDVGETRWNVTETSRQVNTYDVLVGVHGAGLANMVFLPEGGVVLQIIPFGADLWAKPYFGRPTREMGLKYLEYEVGLNESSLLGKYPADSEVYRDPGAVYEKGFFHFHAVYLKDQNVTLDFSRFKEVLIRAYELCL